MQCVAFYKEYDVTQLIAKENLPHTDKQVKKYKEGIENVAITPTTVICLRPLQSVRSPTAWSAA
jgi:hypothetical protein